jgi:hypothetical protein
MAHASDDFRGGQPVAKARIVRHLVSATRELLPEGEPNFLHSSAAAGGNGEERALDDGDPHERAAEGGSPERTLTRLRALAPIS